MRLRIPVPRPNAMTTWTSKGLVAGAMCLALAACDDIAALDGGSGDVVAMNALPSAKLARGSVTLVPPVGYCIDKRSLRASFALMARCDTLGGTATFGAPLALITATTVGVKASQTAGNSFGTTSETVLARRQSDTLTLIQVKGTPPSPDMRDVFWRGIGQVGDQVIGMAIYEAAGGADLGERAPDLLAQSMRRTKAQTAAIQDNSATTRVNPASN